jgi:hypothetical protein
MSQFHNLDADTQAAMHDSVNDERERWYAKRKELIEQFINGHYRFNNEHIFHSIIEALMRDADPLVIIDKLMEMNKDLHERFKEYITYNSTPIRIDVKQ